MEKFLSPLDNYNEIRYNDYNGNRYTGKGYIDRQ